MSNKKRIVTLLNYLKENTNINHPVKAESIISFLEENGFKIERKTVYSDIKELNEMDYIIEKTHYGYYYNSEIFELSELRFLVDAVKSSDVLSTKKTNEIKQKLLSLTNKYDKKIIDNGEYVSNKSLNQQVLYNINEIIMAIEEKKAISFKYYDLDYNDNKVYRNKNYNVFPYSLVINNDRYYLICANIKHPDSPSNYRLDKMEEVEILKKEVKYESVPYEVNKYMDGIFNMYNGEVKNIVMCCSNDIYSEVKQKFGNELIVTQKMEKQFICNVNATIAPTFFSWIFGFMGKITILSPKEVKEEFISECQYLINKHK